MNTTPCAAGPRLRGLIVGVCLPGLCAAQVVLPSPDARAPRALPDPPGVQLVRMPDGSVLKRWPGDEGGPGLATASSARLASAPLPPGPKVVRNGNVLVLAARQEPGAGLAAVSSPLWARQVGESRVLELPGQPAPGVERATTGPGVPAVPAVPQGLRIVELPATAALPAFPEPHTLYRRLRE